MGLHELEGDGRDVGGQGPAHDQSEHGTVHRLVASQRSERRFELQFEPGPAVVERSLLLGPQRSSVLRLVSDLEAAGVPQLLVHVLGELVEAFVEGEVALYLVGNRAPLSVEDGEL